METATKRVRKLERGIQTLSPLGRRRHHRTPIYRADEPKTGKYRVGKTPFRLNGRPCTPGCLRSVKKNGEQSIGRSKGGLTTKIHMMAADANTPIDFILSAGQAHDAPFGRLLMETVGKQKTWIPLLMDRAYEDDTTRLTAQLLGFDPVVPPKKNRLIHWEYDKELYKQRNEVERLFRLIQGFRRIFCRFDKLDKMYIGFIQFAFIYMAIK